MDENAVSCDEEIAKVRSGTFVLGQQKACSSLLSALA
jgi:hypothetical protein